MEDILDNINDIPNREQTYKTADKGKRFGNYIIDFITYMIFAVLIGVVMAMFSEDF